MSYKNKVVLITGAGSGIGEEIALRYGKLSANLSIVDIDGQRLQNTVDKCKQFHGKILQTVVDLTKSDSVKKMIEDTIEEFGRLDVVVNCAGIFLLDVVTSDDFLSNFNAVLDLNLKAVASVCHFAAPALCESKGCIINISSIASAVIGKKMISYNTSKAALNHLSRQIALTLAPEGVRVNCVLPGGVKTNIFKTAGFSDEQTNDFLEVVKKVSPLKRVLCPSDIADTVEFLTSDRALCITGACIPVDCGVLLQNDPVF